MSGKRDGSHDRAAASRSKRQDERPNRQPKASRRWIPAIAVGAVILFALAALLWPPSGGQAGRSPGTPSAGTASTVGAADRVDVVYFHRTERCQTCLWTGEATGWTVKTYFADELASGRVTYQEVDVQKPENAALAKRFRATGSSLFLNFVKDGKDNIVQATDTYPYIGNTERFSERLRSRIAGALGVVQ